MHTARKGEFSAEITFEGCYEQLYDQAGLMIRGDARNWIKTGIEFTGGAQNFSAVVTVDGRSDWSVQRLPDGVGPISARATRLGDAVFVQWRAGAEPWALARLAYFPPSIEELQVGAMLCSPEREGFECTFTDFRSGDPISRDVH